MTDCSKHLQSTISELSAELTRYDNERTRYDKEIARLRAVLSAVESEHVTLLAERAALQTYHDDCQGLSLRSPVRCLPVEILLAIFRICSKPFPPTVALWADREKHRHAHAPLFAVSQVCARWHDIVMGTPSLWSTIDFPQGVWEDLHPEKVTALLKTVIERGAGSALRVVLPPRGTASTKAVDLLVKHSVRWNTAVFTGRFPGLERLSKGRFPLLESLELHLVDIHVAGPTTGDLFHVAPKLKRLVVSESLLRLARPHLQQLQTLEYVGVTLSKVTAALSSMASLSPGTTCRLVLQLVWSGSQRRIPYLTPTLSNVGTLSIEFPQPSCAPDVTDILANLTLPCLENLTFCSDFSSPLPWPHADFLALSSRSSFHTHLRSLNISDFSIGAAELAECLSALPSVQRLEVSDDHREGVEPIIKNSLLSSLILQPDLQALLPHLRHLVFRRSRLQFDDNVFLSFLLSRVSHRQDDSVSGFEVDVYRLRGCRRNFEPGVIARIRELCSQNLLLWTFAQAETLAS
ncbi:F-box domain-containing protein [Mycena venus]|uniref:F-box domain-containing protein n=1 Tax=Mycena venus TaxID=2733690 RepID=A0A8H7DD38_9AGAR|nr:F-box domain-containing protein [Mycena venus]